ncbi:deoxyhypusine synthase isoform X6 [Alligator sinensis]|uniref:Deoxyhypusine synthase n=1 Tax=Alligator sinensis TaxID=38654 RepID=A0A3Q0GNM1_ALLSI|nr:deoxyhypusine synthase isoform X6 [Alligator sinensis]
MLHCGRMESQNGGIQPYGHSARQRMRDPCGAGTEQNGGAQLSGSATCTGLNRDTGHGSAEAMEGLPAVALTAVLKPSEALPPESLPVRGYDFDHGLDHHALLRSFLTTGFQATSFGQAVREIHRMIDAKLEPLGEVAEEENHADLNPCQRPPTGCTIFLGYTSNLISSGIRETIRYLVQHNMSIKWTPSKMIARLGKEINNPESVYYWAQKNNIPVLSPALTDGSLGDMIFFHSYKKPGLVLDIVEDLRLINTQAMFAKKTGMIILGGGLVKHHIANANLMRNGADFSVYVNTAQEFDGSDSGARPDEAVSWGKIRTDAKPVKVYADASLVFPLLVAETFVPRASTFTSDKQHD